MQFSLPEVTISIVSSALATWLIVEFAGLIFHVPAQWQMLMSGLIGAIFATVFNQIIVKRRGRVQLNVLRQLFQKLQQAGLIAPSLKLAPASVDLLSSAFDRLQQQHSWAIQRSQFSEERLRSIADNIPALVAYIDKDRNVIVANHRYEKAYAVDVHELTGKHVRQLLGDDVYAQSAPFMQQVLSGTSTDFERLVTHTGELRWERVSYVPEFSANGVVAGFVSLAEDITELKRAQHTFAKSEMRLRMITDNIPALIAYIDSDEHYIFCNGRYETMLGLAPDKILGQTIRQVAGDIGYKEIAEFVARVLRGERVSFELAPRRHGQRIFQTEFIPDVDMQERVVGFYSMVLDITERKQAEHRQQTSERLLRSVTDNLPAMISYIDTNERFQFNNLPYADWLERPLAEITGQRVVDLLSTDDYARHYPAYSKALAGEKAEFEFAAKRNGIDRIFQVIYLPQSDARETRTGVCVMINDITALKQVENQLRLLARFDTLTGLPNRNQFDEKLAEAIARSKRTGQPIALMFLDIDHFKSINDTLGHHAGDDVLREFALRLTSSVRQTDTVARLAGDEFVIVLEGSNLAQQSTTVAQKIIDAMLINFDIVDTTRKVSTSIGIAIGQEDELDAIHLLRRADAALYDAKAAGRNTYRLAQ